MSGKREHRQTGSQRYCPNCGARTDKSDRFCRECGKALSASGAAAHAPSRNAGLLALGLVVIAIAALFAFLYYGSGGFRESQPPAQRIPISDVQGGGAGGSQPLTPRQTADALFNEAMTAHETGDSATAARFVPMAISAYASLSSLDLDARYHVALLSLAAGRPQDALAQVDTMFAEVPDHLLALAVAARAHDAAGDPQRSTEYYRRFLDAYTPEAVISRPEYLEHDRALTSQREVAQRRLK